MVQQRLSVANGSMRICHVAAYHRLGGTFLPPSIRELTLAGTRLAVPLVQVHPSRFTQYRGAEFTRALPPNTCVTKELLLFLLALRE